jgi:hypothetical protein
MEPENESLIDKILQKFFTYRKESIIGGISLLAIGALLIVAASGKSSYQDFLQTEKLFATWEESPADIQLFDQLSLFLKKHPDLIDKYEAKISQKLIEAGRFEQAALYAESPISRLEIISLSHSCFAETTLLIEAGRYQEALERAIRLKENMSSEDSILYAHNLFRIATLQQRLQNDPGEIAAWNDFEEFLGWKEGKATENFLSQAMLQSYGAEEISLLQYIADRKMVVSSKQSIL